MPAPAEAWADPAMYPHYADALCAVNNVLQEGFPERTAKGLRFETRKAD